MMDCASAAGIVTAAGFMAGSVMVCVGVCAMAATAVFVNRMFAKYWRPVKIFSYVNAMVAADKRPSIKEPKL